MLTEDNHFCVSVCLGLVCEQKKIVPVLAFVWVDMLTEDNRACFSVCLGLVCKQKTIVPVLAFVWVWYVNKR